MQMKVLQLHELLHVLAWLEGTWITNEPAVGTYPTIKPFNYYDEINITSTGQPIFNYIAQSWHADSGTPMHRETGFLQILPETNKIVLSLIDNIGLFTVEQGDLMGDDNSTIDLNSTNIVTTDASIPSFPTLTEVRLSFRIYVYWMSCNCRYDREWVKILYEQVSKNLTKRKKKINCLISQKLIFLSTKFYKGLSSTEIDHIAIGILIFSAFFLNQR